MRSSISCGRCLAAIACWAHWKGPAASSMRRRRQLSTSLVCTSSSIDCSCTSSLCTKASRRLTFRRAPESATRVRCSIPAMSGRRYRCSRTPLRSEFRSSCLYLISPDLEADERIGPERRAYRDVDRIAASCHQYPPDPRHVVAWIERIPASSEIRLEPSGEVHRTVGRRNAYVAEIARAIARRNIHASAEGYSKMGEISADAAPLVQRFPRCSCGARMLVTE